MQSGMLESDALERIMVMAVSGVGLLASILSWTFMGPHAQTSRAVRRYFVSFNLFLAAICAIPLMADVAVTWIVIELTTLASVLLVSHSETRASIEAAWKYAIITLTGSSIALLGFLILYACEAHAGTNTFTWALLQHTFSKIPVVPGRIAVLFIIVGLGTKVGLVPMHTWLPEAYSQAPLPICILLSGGEATAVMGVILRVVFMAEGHAALDIGTWSVVVGLVSIGVAAILMIEARDLVRILAYSSIEQMGIVLVAAGIGNNGAREAAVLQLVAQGFAKAVCFFAVGGVIAMIRTSQIPKIRGLLEQSRPVSILLALGTCAMVGMPPSLLFISELSILQEGVAQGDYVTVALLAIGLAMSFGAMTRAIIGVVSGADPTSSVSVGEIHKDPAMILRRRDWSRYAYPVGICMLFIFAIGGLGLPPHIETLLQQVGLAS